MSFWTVFTNIGSHYPWTMAVLTGHVYRSHRTQASFTGQKLIKLPVYFLKEDPWIRANSTARVHGVMWKARQWTEYPCWLPINTGALFNLCWPVLHPWTACWHECPKWLLCWRAVNTARKYGRHFGPETAKLTVYTSSICLPAVNTARQDGPCSRVVWTDARENGPLTRLFKMTPVSTAR